MIGTSIALDTLAWWVAKTAPLIDWAIAWKSKSRALITTVNKLTSSPSAAVALPLTKTWRSKSLLRRVRTLAGWNVEKLAGWNVEKLAGWNVEKLAGWNVEKLAG